MPPVRTACSGPSPSADPGSVWSAPGTSSCPMMCSRSTGIPYRSQMRGRQLRRGAVHRVREVLRAVHEALVLYADAALVVLAVPGVVRDVQLADHLRRLPVLAHHVVRCRAVHRVLEDLQRGREAALRRHGSPRGRCRSRRAGPRSASSPPRPPTQRTPRLIDLALLARLLDPRQPPPQARGRVPGQGPAVASAAALPPAISRARRAIDAIPVSTPAAARQFLPAWANALRMPQPWQPSSGPGLISRTDGPALLLPWKSYD